MADMKSRPKLIDSLMFAQVVRHVVTYGFPDKKWWMNRRTINLSPEDLSDQWSLLPVIAYMAEEIWTFLGPATGTVFRARFYAEETSQFGYGLSAVETSSKQVAGMAVAAALCLANLPAANFDQVVEAFVRVRDLREGAAES
jgi:hypothetical protein